MGPACGMRTLLATMEPDYRASVVAALLDPTITGTTIVPELDKDGFAVAADSVRRHRKRLQGLPAGCSCEVEE